MKPTAQVTHHQAGVAFASGGVAQALVLQPYIVGIVLDAVRRDLIVGIVGEGEVGAKEEPVAASAHLGREPCQSVVGPSEQLHGTLQILCRQIVGEEVQHTPDGIGAIHECGRPLHHLGTVNAELVNLQSVVVAPLLSFVLDAVLGYYYAVETQSTDDGLRLSAANAHGFYAGDAFQCLHQAAGKMFLQEVAADLHAGQ